ncbi:GW dipeptide domain-containing protein [Trichloromonas sp.]|uniref:GW dipeptide domain-containing protein n=1 Tax=Trichloromonas sp. TaxID=3069249 RepID=UPI003D8144B9
MKKQIFYLSIGALVLTMAAGCKDETPKTTAAPQAPAQTAAPAPAAMQGKSGTVVETMNAAGYTYVQVDTGSEKFWAAAPEFQVAVGDTVAVPEGMPMPNYHSKTLNRDFDLVYFVPAIMAGGAEGAAGGMMAAPAGELPSGHPAIGAPKADDIDLTGIVKVDGGKSIEEIFAGKAELAGQQISVRGKVVKFSAEIMGKNWIHLQDGTGGEGTNDLTITTNAMAKVGDTVVVSGTLTTDKDFGHGYQYDLIIEDGQVTAE